MCATGSCRRWPKRAATIFRTGDRGLTSKRPDIAVQVADEMIQSERVDVMTGIIFSNLAMAVMPVGGQSRRGLSVAQCRPVATGRAGLSIRNYFNVGLAE